MKKADLTYGTAVFINTATKETYTLSGVKDLEHAWRLVAFAAGRNNWNESDVFVKFSTK